MSLIRNLRHAARRLALAPSYTAAAVLTLALTIGAGAAVFGVADGFLFKPLPFERPDRIFAVLHGQRGNLASTFSVPKFFFLRDRTRVFSSLAAYDKLGSGFNLVDREGGGAPERIVGTRVTAQFFDVFGVRPALGRGFRPEDDRPGARPVVVLSHALWSRRFGGDRAVLGLELSLSGVAHGIVGVMPEGFGYPRGVEVWIPYRLDPASADRTNLFSLAGRLRPELSQPAATAAASLAARQLARLHPDAVAAQETLALQPLQEFLYGNLKPALLALLGAAGLVVLIGCVNLVNLGLARALRRQRELAVRVALGAGSGHIVAEVLCETLVLALAGGIGALLAAALALGPLVAASPAASAAVASIGIDGRVCLFILAVSLACAALGGLVPARGVGRAGVQACLQMGGGRTVAGSRRPWKQQLLVGAETALALVLVAGAVLLLRSFSQLVATDPGFSPERVLTMKLPLPEGRYGDPQALDRFSSQALERVGSLPGVAAAALALSLPLQPGPAMEFAIEGRDWRGGREGGGVGECAYRAVTPGFLQTLSIPLLAGRDLTAADRAGAPPVALINQQAASLYWPGESPLGQRIVLGMPSHPEIADPAPRTIVGVVGDVREVSLAQPVPPVVYLPLGQMAPALARPLVQMLPFGLLVRSAAGKAGPVVSLEQIQRQIWSVDPEQPLADVEPMTRIVARSHGDLRFTALVFALVALLALLLAALGMYGVLSVLVAQRRGEIGVRMAMGATGADILRLLLRQGLTPVVAGAAIGLVGALALSRLLQSLLYRVDPQDPLSLLITSLVLLLVAVYACAIPALRASRVSPAVALAQE